MIFKSSSLPLAIALLCASQAMAATLSIREAGNPVDACNGSNNYGVGHSCSWNPGSGVIEGTCQNNSDGDLTCIASSLRRREAGNPVDACNGKNNYGVGHSCSWNAGGGVSEGTCQNDSDGVLTCVPNSLHRREAGNPVDACNGKNNYGVGHSCSWNAGGGVSEGTCQNDSDGVLTCVPNSLRRREAGNPVDACNGKNNYGVGHSCSWNAGGGVSEGTCQNDSDGVLTCVPNSLRRREAGNPVDACNGKNNYGVGHSCSWNAGGGVSEGTCQNDSDGVLTCVPNSLRRREAVNPVDACNGSNNYGVGHSCSWNPGSGQLEGTCQLNGSQDLVCVAN